MTDMDIYTPDEEGRTEKATPSRLKKAREEGKVPRSGELTATVSVLAAVLFLIFWGRRMVAELEWLFRHCMEMAVQENGRFEALAAAALGSFCRAVLPLLFVVFGAALADYLFKSSPLLNMDPVFSIGDYGHFSFSFLLSESWW